MLFGPCPQTCMQNPAARPSASGLAWHHYNTRMVPSCGEAGRIRPPTLLINA
jgi:hypothetical protein